jgi:hypothetical protein
MERLANMATSASMDDSFCDIVKATMWSTLSSRINNDIMAWAWTYVYDSICEAQSIVYPGPYRAL